MNRTDLQRADCISTTMPAQGYAAMIIGIVLSLVVGIGLMALLFYSSRRL